MSDAENNQPQPHAGNAPRGSRRNQQPVQKAPVVRPKRGSTGTGAPKKHMSQQQREAMYQRWLYIGLAVAAGLIVLALAVGALWQFRIMPNQVLATVNGEEITRRDYWKYENITLYNQARLYENMALEYTGQEQSQFLLYSSQLDAARDDIEGSTDVSQTTLSQMIEDRLYVQAAEADGVDMSEPVLRQTALNTWAPTSSPLVTPIPSPTMIPQRAEWATQTAEAQQTAEAEQAALLGTPTTTPSAVSATPVGSPMATPIAATPEATPDMASIEQDAETEYQTFLSDVLPDTGLSEQEYLNLFAKPQVARAHVNANITASVPQSAPQVEVSHILVSTEELANEIYGEVSDGTQTFEDAAMMSSQDTATASNGGKLGWVTDGELPDEINTAIFSMAPGDISAPIQTAYGWHIMMVSDSDDDRALTQTQYDAAIADAQQVFLDEARAANDISSDHYDPTPEPTASVFTPPVNAPTPIVATPVTAPDLSATPVAGPSLPVASPMASPVGSPVATPDATP